jgi:hypothetical protein
VDLPGTPGGQRGVGRDAEPVPHPTKARQHSAFDWRRLVLCSLLDHHSVGRQNAPLSSSGPRTQGGRREFDTYLPTADNPARGMSEQS